MALLESIAVVTHLLFAGLWTGSVAYAAAIVVDADRLGSDGRSLVADRLRSISRTSAVFVFLSGGYLSMGYAGEYFTSTTRGWLLGVMVVLWLVLMVVVEIGASRLVDGSERARGAFLLASLVAVLLLVDAGLVSVL